MARIYQLQDQESNEHSWSLDYRKELNDEQFAAVSSPPGRALVIAGAGSGKTRTLTYRVAWLLDHGVSAREILLLTFTNKASREMVERVKQLISTDLSALWAGTFHSIGNRILRQHAEEVGLTRSFSILDRDDQKGLLKNLIQQLGVDAKSKRFPKGDVILSILSLAQNTGETVEQVLENRYYYLLEWQDAIEQIGREYTKKKRASNSVDFDDLLVLPTKFLRENPAILEMYRRRFRAILVDEYQDTNTVQDELISLLAGERNSLMAVGDDAQSIYSWRGAEVDHILRFEQKFLGATLYKIETNYRSAPEILELSNASIEVNVSKIDKHLRASREELGVKPAIVRVDDPMVQARFVAQRMRELHEQEGIAYGEMAVLYRAHFHSLELQMQLTKQGFPFAITSGLRFFEQAHIKDVASVLRLMANPRDEASFRRLMGLLSGVGPAATNQLWKAWEASVIANGYPESWSKLMLGWKIPAKAKKEWEQLVYTFDELTENGVLAKPSAMIFSIIEGFYRDYAQASFEQYEQRESDLVQWMNFAQGYENLEEFLAEMSLLGEADAGKDSGEKPDAVTLSSIHQAKGLEWKVVFVIWLADGAFPNSRILDAGDEAALEEERRLFYVAITRAKDHLYLSYPLLNPKAYSGEIMQKPSRFLSECPAELTEVWDLQMGF